MANVVVYSENAALAAELVTAARVIDADVVALAVNDAELAGAVAALGVDVLSVSDDAVALGDTAQMALVVKQAVEAAGAHSVVLASNRRGKELAGRVAQVLGAGCLTDVGALEVRGGTVVASRNALGGATIADCAVTTDAKVYAISAKSFLPAEAGAAGTVSELAVDAPATVKVVEVKEKAVESVDLSAADVLVCVGQGFDEQAQTEQAQKIADAVGGEVACSKPIATDRKWFSESRIVGISGTLCKPDLAITLGVSGQVQFSVGVRDAKTIVAVDKDEAAPIFQVADYGLVADLQDALPELVSALS